MFSESERKVFSYIGPNGQTLYEDPLRLRRELIIASNGEIEDWLKQEKTKEEIEALPEHVQKQEVVNQYKLQSKLVSAMRQALGNVPGIDFTTGAGILDSWVLETFQSFLSWLNEKKAV